MRKKVIDNPRYPHTIKIVRTMKCEERKEDETEPMVDPDDPLADQDAVPVDDSGSTETVINIVEKVLYEGKGRSYTGTTTTGDDTTDMNKRKASIPVRYDKWGAGEVPLDGDTIIATMGNYVERGIVKDCEPDNDRSVVYWEYVRV